MNLISRTIDDHQIVEELVLVFTHTMAMEWMLPQIQPTGKKVEIGLLNPKGLPVAGGESARHLLNLKSATHLEDY